MSKWIVEPDHSVGTFSIGHLMVANVHGQLNKVAGTLHFNPPDVTSLSVELEIDTASIITGVQKRDEHLKSADFFDAEKYPKITFKSTKSERTGFSSCKVSGDLTIHGITKSIAIDVTVSGPVKSPFGETSIGLTGSIVLNREEFGLMWNVPVENTGLMVDKDVAISVDIEADLTE
jgi:polyisoprenoid-binding protein YceI